MASILKATRLAPVLRAYAVQRPSVYILGDRSMTNFKDKERGEETVHFRKADEELLRKLLQKVNAPRVPRRFPPPCLHCALLRVFHPSLHCPDFVSSPLTRPRLSDMPAGRQYDFSMQVKAQADSADSSQAQESAQSELQSLKATPIAQLWTVPMHAGKRNMHVAPCKASAMTQFMSNI